MKKCTLCNITYDEQFICKFAAVKVDGSMQRQLSIDVCEDCRTEHSKSEENGYDKHIMYQNKKYILKS